MRRGSDFTQSDFKMLLLKLGSELQNLVKKLLSAMKILTKYKLHIQSGMFPRNGMHRSGRKERGSPFVV